MESTKFKYLDDNLKSIVSKACSNQNFLRYVMYLTNEPLALNAKDKNGNIVSQPNLKVNLIDTGNLILDNFSVEIINEEKIKLFLHSTTGSFNDLVTSDDYFALDITYPYTCNILQGYGKTRYNQLAYEFCKAVDLQMIGAGKVQVYGYSKGGINDKFGVLTIKLKISNASVGKL